MRKIVSLMLFLWVGGVSASAEVTLTGDFFQHQVVGKLHRPWAATPLPDGGWLITERDGHLVLVNASYPKKRIALPIDDLYVAGQGGLLDVTLAPDYLTSKTVFVTYSAGDSSANTLKVAKVILDIESPTVTEIFSVRPLRDTPVHYGGRLIVLPDHTLLLSSGDGFDYREQAQVMQSELGKTLRFDMQGEPVSDNPFFSSHNKQTQYVYTLGHRNPQGLLFDDKTKQLLLNEHGPDGGDEINLLSAGKNYGWPVVTLGKDYSGARISPFRQYPGMIAPVFNWTPSIAPSSMAMYHGEMFPALNGMLLVTSLKNKAVYALDLRQNPIQVVEIFATINQRLRDVIVGTDGAIYILTDEEEGRLLKFSPVVEKSPSGTSNITQNDENYPTHSLAE